MNLIMIKLLFDVSGSFGRKSHCIIATVQNLISVNSLIVNFRAQNDFDVPAVTKTKREKTHDLNLITFTDIHHSFQS